MLDEFMEEMRYTYYFLYDRCHNKHQYTPPKLMRRMIHSLILSCDNLIREIFKMAGDAVSCSDMLNNVIGHLYPCLICISAIYKVNKRWSTTTEVSCHEGQIKSYLILIKLAIIESAIIVSKKNQRTLKGKRVEHA